MIAKFFYTKHEYKLESKVLIPTLLTFANALCGFISILYAIEHSFIKSAAFIGVAACLDLCDGRLARAWGTSSSFGEQLDSLCDAISFCLAPVVLLYSFFDVTQMHLVALGAYLCAGLFRLARFNCTRHENANSFKGLSTPVSAFFLASLILYHQWFELHMPFFLNAYVALLLIVSLAWLMISSIRFSAFKKMPVPTRFLYIMIGIGCIAGVIAVRYHVPLVFVALGCYIVGHVMLHLAYKATYFSIARSLFR